MMGDISSGKFAGDNLDAAVGMLNSVIKQYQEIQRSLKSAYKAVSTLR